MRMYACIWACSEGTTARKWASMGGGAGPSRCPLLGHWNFLIDLELMSHTVRLFHGHGILAVYSPRRAPITTLKLRNVFFTPKRNP